jgi:hypothetical protein
MGSSFLSLASTVAPFIPGLGQVGTVLGAISAAQGLKSSFKKPQKEVAGGFQVPEEEAFTPTRPNEMQAPQGFENDFAGFSPEQTRSALATRGINLGLGSQEDAYYKNLLQRSLIDESGNVTQNQDFLLPVESQYFSRRGVDTSNIMNFLKSIR